MEPTVSSASNFIETLKELFLDIIGYLFPGIFFVFLYSTLFKSDYLFSSEIIPLIKGNSSLFLIVISYLIGYIVYGLGALIEDVVKNLNFSAKQNIISEIKDSDEFKKTRKILAEKLENNEEKMGFSSVRNFAMSYSSDSEKKIFTFMFRADMSYHIGLVCLIFGLIGAGLYFPWLCSGKEYLVKQSHFFGCLYVVLIISSFLLIKTMKRFYRIALKLIFPIFLASYYPLNNGESD